MRSFATVAILTALVGFLMGAALAATDPDLGQGPTMALAAGETPANGLMGGLLQAVSKPLMRALNVAAGPMLKTGAADAGQNNRAKDAAKDAPKDAGKTDKPAAAGSGGGGKR